MGSFKFQRDQPVVFPENEQQRAPVVLLITYTMLQPIVGGAFFRALRLAVELHQRGWDPVICNSGPELDDPKYQQARNSVRFVNLDSSPPYNWQAARKQFQDLQPDVVIMGEYPFETMEVFFKGAEKLACPLVVLDQFYHNWLVPPKKGIDLVLLYGLKSYWKSDFHLKPPYMLVPPFIETITPKPNLPVPPQLQDQPWITFVAYDDRVLEEGVGVLRGLQAPSATVVSVSPMPERAAQMLKEAGIDPRLTVTLPLVDDSTLYGLIESSRVAMLSNGFIQIMDSLALGTPVIALPRWDLVGMGELNIDRRFFPYVSLEQGPVVQRKKILRWLAKSPFPPDLRESLKMERGGVSRCADLIEDLVKKEAKSRLWRLRRLWAGWAN